MALASYSDLKTALPAWLWGRTDLTTYLDDFIDLFEARANRVLRVREMETSDATLSLTDGEVSLPSDYLEWRRVTALTSPNRTLEFVTPGWLQNEYPQSTVQSGLPRFFTIEGSKIKVRPTNSSLVRLDYYQTIPALSDANMTNWLLTKSPGAYLHGTVLEAAIFIGDDQRAAEMNALLERDLADLRADDKGGRWATGGARVSMVTP